MSLLSCYEHLERLFVPPGTDPYAGWCKRAEVVRSPPISIRSEIFSLQISDAAYWYRPFKKGR